MKDPKKQAQAQAQAQERVTERPEDRQERKEEVAVRKELVSIYNHVVNGRMIVEVDRHGMVGAIESEQHGKVEIILIKNGTSPSIIFDWDDSDENEAWEEMINNPRYNSMSKRMGIKWGHGKRYDEIRGESKNLLGLTLEFFELKNRYKGDNLLIYTEAFETSESKDFAFVFLEVLNRVEELYTVPYWKTIEGGRFKWANMLD